MKPFKSVFLLVKVAELFIDSLQGTGDSQQIILFLVEVA